MGIQTHTASRFLEEFAVLPFDPATVHYREDNLHMINPEKQYPKEY
jgi:hypothetical protein